MPKAADTYCQYHCRACGYHFASLDAFDMHRKGSHSENTRRCIGPSRLRRLRSYVGVCRVAAGRDTPQPRQVWRAD